jgi:hypothetical protein
MKYPKMMYLEIQQSHALRYHAPQQQKHLQVDRFPLQHRVKEVWQCRFGDEAKLVPHHQTN